MIVFAIGTAAGVLGGFFGLRMSRGEGSTAYHSQRPVGVAVFIRARPAMVKLD
jgi:hypothetical protein